MSLANVKADPQALLGAFEAAASAAGATETARRRQLEAEILRLEQERAFAYRRLNFMRSLSEGIAAAGSPEQAVAAGCALLRSELGWAGENDSETRSQTLTRLAPVIAAAHACMTGGTAQAAQHAMHELVAFEDWYAERFGQPFWALFELHVEELPLVERG